MVLTNLESRSNLLVNNSKLYILFDVFLLINCDSYRNSNICRLLIQNVIAKLGHDKVFEVPCRPIIEDVLL